MYNIGFTISNVRALFCFTLSVNNFSLILIRSSTSMVVPGKTYCRIDVMGIICLDVPCCFLNNGDK